MANNLIFSAFAALALLSSCGVILLRNPVMSALSLITSFFCVSGIYVLLHAPFLGVIQVLIYAGAILVLFLYVLMLLNLQEEPWLLGRLGTLKRLSLGLGVAILTLLSFRHRLDLAWPAWVDVSESFGGIASIGERLLREYVIVFELLSLILLAGIVGVVAIIQSKETDA